MPRIRQFRDLRVYRAPYRAAMVVFRATLDWPNEERYGLISQARRSSREAEAAETRAHLDFAVGCGYLHRAAYLALDARYAAIIRQLVRMATQPPHWAPGRASGRTAGEARETPTSRSPEAARKRTEEARRIRTAANDPPVPKRSPARERPPKEDRR